MSMPMNSVRRDRRARTPLGAVLALCLALVSGAWAGPIWAQGVGDETFSAAELIDSGHRLFGSVSRGLALTVQEAVKRWGEPNGYVLGEEASGALFGGVRYGEGVLGGFKWSWQHGLCELFGGTGPEPRPGFSSPGSFAACC